MENYRFIDRENENETHSFCIYLIAIFSCLSDRSRYLREHQRGRVSIKAHLGISYSNYRKPKTEEILKEDRGLGWGNTLHIETKIRTTLDFLSKTTQAGIVE